MRFRHSGLREKWRERKGLKEGKLGDMYRWKRVNGASLEGVRI